MKRKNAERCANCGGGGVVSEFVHQGFCGLVKLRVKCPRCKGTGKKKESA